MRVFWVVTILCSLLLIGVSRAQATAADEPEPAPAPQYNPQNCVFFRQLSAGTVTDTNINTAAYGARTVVAPTEARP